jgi:glucan-binding YG repeat protein
MKYLESLKKRGLSVENLPKALQKKIKELDFQLNALKQVQENPNEDLSESDLEDIKVIEASIQDLDKYIAHKIDIFDQAKYDNKLANISKAKEARLGNKVVEEVVKQEVVKEPEVAKPVVAKVQEEPKQVQVEPKKQIQEQPQVAQEEAYQHEEEFEKVGDAKPKSMTTGLILMGVGAFFLTWGAVNFFKSRR